MPTIKKGILTAIFSLHLQLRKQTRKTMNQLDTLKQASIVVADTGDINAIAEHKPTDATTNPSLLLKAAQQEDYQHILKASIDKARMDDAGDVSLAQDYFTAELAKKILALIPGYLSIEVDARSSFNTQATLERTEKMLSRFTKAGVDTSRLLIKIAGTWEGIQAAKVLEAKGIKCNVTLLFSMAQVIACAEANAFLISPFVGRVYDWFKNNGHEFDETTDPGVVFVKEAYHYLKSRGSETITMAASFRQCYQILALSGCDRQTISPSLLSELSENTSAYDTHITQHESSFSFQETLTEAEFRWMLNEDAMATEKLADGIRRFAQDQNTLDLLLLS